MKKIETYQCELCGRQFKTVEKSARVRTGTQEKS